MPDLFKTKIVFPEIRFKEPGVYNYTIRELAPSDKNWKAASRVYRAIVTISEDGDGKLESRVEYPDGYPCFENKYCALPPVKPCVPRPYPPKACLPPPCYSKPYICRSNGEGCCCEPFILLLALFLAGLSE